MNRTNSLQAVLAREAVVEAEAPVTTQSEVELKPEKFHRPSREGRRFLGGHFAPKVVRQMKMLAVEEDTTTQALLEEALDLLFVKKGKGKIIGV